MLAIELKMAPTGAWGFPIDACWDVFFIFDHQPIGVAEIVMLTKEAQENPFCVKLTTDILRFLVMQNICLGEFVTKHCKYYMDSCVVQMHGHIIYTLLN